MSMLADLERRFGKLATHINGGMFLGHDIEVDKEKDVIMLRLRTYMERVIESILEKGTEGMALNSNVGILNWACSCVFGTHLKDARNLASSMNLELQEDIETSLALIHELHEKREQGIYFRNWNEGKISSNHELPELKASKMCPCPTDLEQRNLGESQ
jgi:hypothetical protein